MTDASVFVRKERQHLDVLQQRLEHVQVHDPSRSGDPAYPKGEAKALVWALAVLNGQVEPVELRVSRLELRVRQQATEIGRLTNLVGEWDEDDD